MRTLGDSQMDLCVTRIRDMFASNMNIPTHPENDKHACLDHAAHNAAMQIYDMAKLYMATENAKRNFTMQYLKS